MSFTLTRRQALILPAAVALSHRIARAEQQQAQAAWSLPLRNEQGVPGDGFFMHYGYACENIKNHPEWLHTAEDWHRDDGADTAGAEVLAVHDGDVAWVGSDYPGRVILVLHDSGVYSVYAHLDYEVDVAEGQRVAVGQVLGRVLAGTNWHATNHLHFEIRDFFFNPIVNGDSPSHGVKCGYQCAPGPGYWPLDDARHPSEIGWRNPMHVIQRGFASQGAFSEAMVAAGADGLTMPLRESPSGDARMIEEIVVRAGERLHVLEVDVGDPASVETSTLGYHVWYRVALSAVMTGWLQAVMPDDYALGSDGRPTGVRPVLLPLIG